MGHYAYVTAQGIVDQVITATQDVIDTGAFGNPSSWVKTSYNTYGGIHYQPNVSPATPSLDQSKSLRKNYAGIGFTYNVELDAFVPPQPYPSWVLDLETCLWNAPTLMPIEGGPYIWNETTQSWDVRDLQAPQ
jgi:hypothetical protein